MKKLVLLAMVATVLTIINGCQKDEMVSQLADEQLQEAVKPDVYLENGYLAFKNMEAVDSVIQMLGKMTTSEKEAWENQIGLKSARSEFDKLFEEYDKLESYEAFLAFKKRNLDKLKFNETDPDDCSIDYPFETKYFLPILNKNGVYKLSNAIVTYTNHKMLVMVNGQTHELNLNVSIDDKILIEDSLLKSSTPQRISLYNFPEDDPLKNNNPWHRKSNISDRKLKNELYFDGYVDNISGETWSIGYVLLLDQHGQKVSWGKWRDYETEYGIGQIKFQLFNGSIWHDSRIHYSGDVKPSAKFVLATEFNNQSFPYPFVPPFPTASVNDVKFASKVSFRGFGFDYNNDFYLIDNPANYGLAQINQFPSLGWGY
jgi:hypothetical protein